MVSLGLQKVDQVTIIAADAAIRASDKIVARVGGGNCSYGGESSIVFGGGVGVNVWNDAAGKVAVNVQAGLEMDSYEGGNERNIPIGLAVRYRLSGGSSARAAGPGLLQGGSSADVSLYGSGAMHIYNDSYEGESYSSNDPAVSGGVIVATGNFQVTAGVTMFMYDGGSEMGFNVGGGMAVGTASNAIRKIGSLFARK
jgi:hypothetical protein